MNFNIAYVDLPELPWDIILNIQTIFIMNEFHKYIIKFDFIAFLGFKNWFV